MISPVVDRAEWDFQRSRDAECGDPDRTDSIDQCAAVFRREESRSAALATALCASGIDANNCSAMRLRVLVEAKRVKLLILDNQMGGFFTGMEVLRKLRSGQSTDPGHRARRRQAGACQRGEDDRRRRHFGDDGQRRRGSSRRVIVS